MANVSSTLYPDGNTTDVLQEGPEDEDVFIASSWQVIVKTFLLCITTVMILVGNSFCLVVLKHCHNISDISRQFMYSLSVADLFIGVIIALPAAVSSPLGFWPFGRALCYINSHIGGAMGFITSWSLVALSAERYLAITMPLRYPSIVTLRGTRITLASIWIGAMLFETLVAYMYNFNVYFDAPTYMCWFLSLQSGSWITFVSFILFLVAPLILIVTLYARMYHIARGHLKRIHAEESSLRSLGKNTKTESKAATTFVIITVAYGMCATPGIVFSLYTSITGSDIASYYQFLVFIAVYGNSWVNTLVYYARTKAFRNTAKQLLADAFGIDFQPSRVEPQTTSSTADDTQMSHR